MTGTDLMVIADGSHAPSAGDAVPTGAWCRQHGYMIVRANGDTPDERLIPRGRAVALEREAGRAMQACGPRRAVQHAADLLACWPTLAPHDPARYAAKVAEVLAELPDDLAAAAAKLIGRESRWPPSVADVHHVSRKLMLMRERVVIAARSHVEQHDQRAAARAERGKLDAAAAVVPDFEHLIWLRSIETSDALFAVRRTALAAIDARQAQGEDHAVATLAVCDELRAASAERRRKIDAVLAEHRRERERGDGHVADALSDVLTDAACAAKGEDPTTGTRREARPRGARRG